MSTHVNAGVSIGAASTAATAYSATIPAGTGIIAGDLIIVNAAGNGTHVLNGMSCTDNVDVATYTQIKEQQQGGSSTHYQQTFYHVATQNYADGSLITFTPFAASTVNSFSVDVFRYALGTIVQAVVGTSIASGTSLAASALGAAPPIGSLVLSMLASTSGALTPPVALTQGSANGVSGSQLTSTGFVSADGTSTFAETWSSAAATTAAGQVVAFQNAAIGVPYKIGSQADAAGASTTVVTVGSNGGMSSIAGDALFCCLGIGAGSTVTPTGVVDSKSHAWTQIGAFVATNGMACYVYQSLHATTPIVSTGTPDTVTVSWSGTTYAKFAEVIGCSGVNQTAALDLTKTASATSAAPSATTAASLTNNNELVLSLVTAGSASAGITWAAPVTAMDSGLHVTGGVYFSAGTQVALGNTAPATAGATLGATAVWAELLLTLLPDPPTGAAATVTVGGTTPAGQVGVAYTSQLTATGGTSPYTWSVSAGSLPAGLSLEPGGGSGSSGDFGYVGVNTGPQGAPTAAQFSSSYSTLGPIGCYKVFYSAGGSGIYTGYLGGDANGGSNAFSSGLEGQITTAKPGTFIYVSWGVKMSAAAINTYCSQIPHSVAAVGFTYQSEPENAYSLGAGAQFVADWNDQAQKIRAAQANTPVQLVLITSHFEGHYQDGTLTGSSFIPPAGNVDVYGFDFYDRHNYWVGSDMSTNKAWVVWTGLVKALGRPLALTEYGISGATAADQNSRLQSDIAYLKSAFGPGGSLSQSPLYLWLYWNTGGTSFALIDPITGKAIQNEMLSAAVQATWKGLAGTAGGQSGGTGGGGLISGTPTTAAGSPFSFTAKATDTNAAFGTKAFSLTVTSSNALAITTTSPLSGGTIGTSYSTLLTASGGTAPYTWSLNSGSLPAGLAISGQQITGTPTGSPSNPSFVLKVTDNVSATATLTATLQTSSGLTFSTTSLPAGTAGAAYTATLAASGGTTPYTWSVASGTLPDGLTLDPVLGVITGTPTTPGSPVLTFTVTDSAGATGAQATSAQMTLAISLGSGGLPALPRFTFGGGESDFGFQFSGTAMVKAASVAYSFWTAKTAGSQITDLTDTAGNPIASALVTSDGSGFLGEFHGPAGTLEMYADSSGAAGTGPRYRVTARNLSSSYIVLYNAVKGVTG